MSIFLKTFLEKNPFAHTTSAKLYGTSLVAIQKVKLNYKKETLDVSICLK